MSQSTKKTNKENTYNICAFCGKHEREVDYLVLGPAGTNICNNCIDLCKEIVDDELKENVKNNAAKCKEPAKIKAYLDEYIIGQEEAKKTLSVAVYNHYLRLNQKKKSNGVDIQKSNVLLLGPSGSGKTYMIKTLADSLGVPFAASDATGLTEAGYVGDDVENVLLRLIEAADWDLEAAQKGIVYIDEIDKIAKKGQHVSLSRDVSGEGVQQALLKIIEGDIVEVQEHYGRKLPNDNCVKIDTSNILFIVGGAFVGMERTVDTEEPAMSYYTGEVDFSKGQGEFAFETDINYKELTATDFIHYGLIPEFVGRIPVIAEFNPLTKADLYKILTEPKNAIIKQYKAMMKMNKVDLEFEDGAIHAIAEKAFALGTGARGLRGILEKLLRDVMFHVPSDKSIKSVLITKAYVWGAGPVEYTYRQKKTKKEENA